MFTPRTGWRTLQCSSSRRRRRLSLRRDAMPLLILKFVLVLAGLIWLAMLAAGTAVLTALYLFELAARALRRKIRAAAVSWRPTPHRTRRISHQSHPMFPADASAAAIHAAHHERRDGPASRSLSRSTARAAKDSRQGSSGRSGCAGSNRLRRAKTIRQVSSVRPSSAPTQQRQHDNDEESRGRGLRH